MYTVTGTAEVYYRSLMELSSFFITSFPLIMIASYCLHVCHFFSLGTQNRRHNYKWGIPSPIQDWCIFSKGSCTSCNFEVSLPETESSMGFDYRGELHCSWNLGLVSLSLPSIFLDCLLLLYPPFIYISILVSLFVFVHLHLDSPQCPF